MAKQPENTPAQIDPEQVTPQTSADYVQRGWLYYNQQDFQKAEQDFREALQNLPGDVDANFALALTLKSMGKSKEAIQIFQKINSLTDNLGDRVRATMIKRLSRGHINNITRGDWDLEKEVWSRKGA
jgi:Tfp pilus assembly protein PilF